MTDDNDQASGVRIATPEDADILAAISVEVWLDTYAVEGVSLEFARYVQETYAPAALRARMDAAGTKFIVFRDRDFILGYAKLVLGAEPVSATSGTAEVETLYVRRNHHRRGIGKRLLDTAAALAAQAGHNRVFVKVYQENHRALAFYERLGLTVDGPWTFLLNGRPVPNIIMTHACRAT